MKAQFIQPVLLVQRIECKTICSQRGAQGVAHQLTQRGRPNGINAVGTQVLLCIGLQIKSVCAAKVQMFEHRMHQRTGSSATREVKRIGVINSLGFEHGHIDGIMVGALHGVRRAACQCRITAHPPACSDLTLGTARGICICPGAGKRQRTLRYRHFSYCYICTLTGELVKRHVNCMFITGKFCRIRKQYAHQFPQGCILNIFIGSNTYPATLLCTG